MARRQRHFYAVRIFIFIVSLGIGAWACLGSACAGEPTSARQLYAEGKALLHAKQRAEAVAKLQQAAEQAQAEGLSPDEQALFFRLLGLALSGAERDAEAVAALKRSLALDPRDAECHLELGQSLARQRLHLEARAEAQEALRLGLSDARDQADAAELIAMSEARQLFAEGRQLLKERQLRAAAARLAESASKGRQAHQSADELSLTYYVLGLTLSRDERDDEAIAAFRKAIELSPSDADSRLELAQLLLRNDRHAEARAESEKALSLGLTDAQDQQDARQVVSSARTGYLRERFSANAWVSFGFDSNVLESPIVTSVGGHCATCTQAGRNVSRNSESAQQILSQIRSQTMLIQNLVNQYSGSVTSLYNTAAAPQQEWDLPVTLQVELNGRLFGYPKLEMWAGYRFYQYLLTSIAYDHDGYNLQEHTVPVYLLWQPLRWLRLRPRVDGFVNFTGLKQFTAYQGGLRASVDATFIESKIWRTRLFFQHQYRRSFDRTNDAYLDGNRDDVRLTQEVRLEGGPVRVRGQLSYRFRLEQTGVFTVDTPFTAEFLFPKETTARDVTLGTFIYSAPLGYLGNEVATRWRLFLPRRFEAAAGVGYEYRLYDSLYSALFAPMTAQVPEKDQLVTLPPAGTPGTIAMPSMKRRDSLVSVDASVLENLPLGFSLEIAYSFLQNFSTIANSLDNRNYTKHTLVLNGYYAF